MSFTIGKISDPVNELYSDKHGLMINILGTPEHINSGIGIPVYISKGVNETLISNAVCYPTLLNNLLEMAKKHERINNWKARFESFWPESQEVNSKLIKAQFNLLIEPDIHGFYVLFIIREN